MKGHITIYFSLLLLMIFSLLCTMIESARLGGVRIRCQSGAYLALESVFADYHLPVAREYGLLMLDKSYGTENPEEYQSYLLDYMSCNIAANKELVVPGADFCQAAAEGVSLQSERIVAGEGGMALEEEILAYMKYAAPTELIGWVTDKLGLIDEAETVEGMMDGLSELRSEASEVDLAVQSMNRGLEEIMECSVDVEGMARRICTAADELEELNQDYEHAVTAAEKVQILDNIHTLERSITLQVQEISHGYQTLLEHNRYVVGQIERYDRNTQRVGEKLSDLEREFALEKEQLSTDMKKTVEAELKNIRVFSAGEGDYYEIGPAARDIVDNIALLEDNLDMLSPYLTGETDGLKSVVTSCMGRMNAYRTENLKLNYSNEKISGKGTNVMEVVKELLGKGLLGLVVENPDKISGSAFAGRSLYEDGFGEYSYEDEELHEQILINEYLLSRFGNFAEPASDKVLCYELEYILGGKETDKENLVSVATQLLLLRTPLNFVYLIGSAEKRAEAEGLAWLLVGFTGMYGVVKLTELLILAAWAQAEAIVDVRELFSGGRVPLLKDDHSWRLGMEGLTRLSASKLPAIGGMTDGFSYKDYLRVLLVKEKRCTRNGRTLDLIEGVIQKKYDAGFSLRECVTELVILTEFKVEPMFLMLPFPGEGYHIEGTSSYAY